MSIKLIAILLFVAFNILSGWMKKRAQKKQVEAMRNGTGTTSGVPPYGASPTGASPAGNSTTGESASTSLPARNNRNASRDNDSDWEAVRAEDETAFDVDGEEGRHPRKWQQDQSRDTRGKPERTSPNALASQPGPTGRGASGNKVSSSAARSGGPGRASRTSVPKEVDRSGPVPGEAPSARDLLSQLARDMGLKLPSPQPPSKPQAAQPARTASAQAALRSPVVTAPSDEFLSNTQATLAAIQANPNPGSASAGMAARLGAEFADPESLRRAFILKTILDKPLSMQPRVPGF